MKAKIARVLLPILHGWLPPEAEPEEEYEVGWEKPDYEALHAEAQARIARLGARANRIAPARDRGALDSYDTHQRYVPPAGSPPTLPTPRKRKPRTPKAR